MLLKIHYENLPVVLLVYCTHLSLFCTGIEEHKFCLNTTIKDIPIVYLTLNPISTVSWLGTITQRQLVMNWKWPSSNVSDKTNNVTGLNDDWIGLFDINISNITNLTGKNLLTVK